jgi:transaldolase
MNPLRQLNEHGQVVWMDFIRRDLLTEGGLRRLVEEDGVTGVTSNPAIFEQAIGRSDEYNEQIAALLEAGEPGVMDLYEALVFEDIRLAADVLRPVHDASNGSDGFVSLEVSPHLAYDTQGTVDQALDLWRRVDRPNLMIKVPATDEGIPAIEELLAHGVNVNVTLMFSLADYEAVAGAYLRGVARLEDPSRVSSVASFFVSRVDSKVDALLDVVGTPEALALRGAIAIANSKLAYRRYEEIFHGEAFAEFRDRGALVQRVLWASTSTKNPDYRDVVYVEELVGPQTVNTVPPKTIEAFRDHGEVRSSLIESVDEAALTADLKSEGVDKFVRPFDQLLETLERKRQELTASAGA